MCVRIGDLGYNWYNFAMIVEVCTVNLAVLEKECKSLWMPYPQDVVRGDQGMQLYRMEIKSHLYISDIPRSAFDLQIFGWWRLILVDCTSFCIDRWWFSLSWANYYNMRVGLRAKSAAYIFIWPVRWHLETAPILVHNRPYGRPSD